MKKAILCTICFSVLAVVGIGCLGQAYQHAEVQHLLDEAGRTWSGLHNRMQSVQTSEADVIANPTGLVGVLERARGEKAQLLSEIDKLKPLYKRAAVLEGRYEQKLQAENMIKTLDAYREWLVANQRALDVTAARFQELECPVEACKVLEGYWPDIQAKFDNAETLLKSATKKGSPS